MTDALAELNEALRLDPNLSDAHCNIGIVLGKMGRRDEAVAHLREALQLEPNSEKARQALAALGQP
jgi:Flp pilus assembly protein TadD